MNKGGWQVWDRAGRLPHVVPVDDLKPHDLSKPCWCGATDDGEVVVHHAMDRREEYERGRPCS